MHTIVEKIKHIYEKKYMFLLAITLTIVFLAIGQIVWQYTTTGDFLHKGVSLKGGVTITIPGYLDAVTLESALRQQYPQNDISVRYLRGSSGEQSGIVVDADISEVVAVQDFVKVIKQQTGITELGVESFGSRLSQDFFKQLFIGLFIAFIFMGLVVFLYFRVFVPSIAVMLSAASDIIITLAILNLTGFKLSTAGIAALLMLIGYSVDTDLLLTIRVLKQKDTESVNEAIYGAIKTGGLMTLTAIAAVVSVLLFTNSEVMYQIMHILCIGLFVDLVTTWIQNVSILRWYLDKGDKQ
ncbi:MAG: protein translocase subunit SecF [Candidatus Woesearchaeota archaeon]